MTKVERLARWLHEQWRKSPIAKECRPRPLPWSKIDQRAQVAYEHVARQLLNNPPAALRKAAK